MPGLGNSRNSPLKISYLFEMICDMDLSYNNVLSQNLLLSIKASYIAISVLPFGRLSTRMGGLLFWNMIWGFLGCQVGHWSTIAKQPFSMIQWYRPMVVP
mmetsp:Transcript_3385/g.8619  ORF Transcript_3385/g.8619 Transcript_3385/m.8619 type:complete len:100 (-) Transcript_3385:715-1014(-)